MVIFDHVHYFKANNRIDICWNITFIVYSAYSHNVVDDGPVTKVSCLDSGHFLGNSSLQVVTIVDTPGKA
jgi:hypothetical protein